MIRACFGRERPYLKVTGHAGYDVKGKDLVCAGVSCILTGFCEFMYDELGCDMFPERRDQIVLEKGKCIVDIKYPSVVENIYDVMNLVYTQLRCIEDEYPQYLNIVLLDNKSILNEGDQ